MSPTRNWHKNITPFEGLYYGIISWLGRKFLVKTFEEEMNEEDLERCIQEIRELIDELDTDT
jgi:hypothetical protein